VAYSDNNTIALKIDSIGGAGSSYDEVGCTVAITPGHLCEMADDNSGGRIVRPHSSSGHPAEKMFAVENGYVGGGISDVYAIGERVYLRICRPGDLVLAWLAGTVGTTYVGQYLTSNADGTLRFYSEVTDEPGCIVCVAYEKITNTGSDQRIAIRIV
jgi:hypothetical protein